MLAGGKCAQKMKCAQLTPLFPLFEAPTITGLGASDRIVAERNLHRSCRGKWRW
jgi:hypothetical protein